MCVHKFNENSLSDDEFIKGDIKYLVKENKCRLLDGRRTPGYIEAYFPETAMFRWKITDFEDEGKYWDVPAENIKSFQILKGSKKLDDINLKKVELKISELNKELHIEIDELEKARTQNQISVREDEIKKWLKEKSTFIKRGDVLDLDSTKGNMNLFNDLKNYMKFMGIELLEENTAKEIVLNPNSEWIKCMKIVLAEMGMVSYKNKVPRRKESFQGIGKRELRRNYLIHRIAFLRAYFHLLNIDEVLIYRGMCTEGEWSNSHEKSLTSWTFNLQVALSFCRLDKDNKYRNGYILKRTVPVEYLFMTYLETEAMNRQYEEAEAILFFNKEKGIH